jgi:hypothetical protein
LQSQIISSPPQKYDKIFSSNKNKSVLGELMATKESAEVIDLLDGLSNFIREAKADGVVDFKDLPKAFPLIMLSKNAISGSEQILTEIKGYNSEEQQEMLDRLINAVTALVESVLR